MNATPLHELYLAGIVVHGLTLPLMAGPEAPKYAPGPKPWLRTVWAGQAVVALSALAVIFSPLHPAFGLGLAAAGCSFFGWRLSRQLCLTPNQNQLRHDR